MQKSIEASVQNAPDQLNKSQQMTLNANPQPMYIEPEQLNEGDALSEAQLNPARQRIKLMRKSLKVQSVDEIFNKPILYEELSTTIGDVSLLSAYNFSY